MHAYIHVAFGMWEWSFARSVVLLQLKNGGVAKAKVFSRVCRVVKILFIFLVV